MKRSGQYVSQLRGYKAFIPTNLPPIPAIKISGEMEQLLKKAELSLANLNGISNALPNIDLFIGMYVKKEALISAQIEGTQASLEDIFEFETGKKLENINDVEEVVNYIKALNYGIKRLKTLPMSLKLLKELHNILLKGTRGFEKTPGEFRKTQNWIGPAGCNLQTASFVPPPPDEMIKSLGKLELYMHAKKSILPDLVDCALIHYQFETIHPFLDGNGRLGRLLITFYLYWKNILRKPLLYLSYYFKKNRQEYYDRLSMVRTSGNYEQWISFFLTGIIETSESAITDIKKILELKEKHFKLMLKEKISSPNAIVLLNQIFYTPLVSINDVQSLLGISHQAASNLISDFEKIGIVKEITGKKRDKRFIYKKYLQILAQGTTPI
ncbi:Fic family protein [Candidatus Dependentiae bacterium]|nr:Fic family protein [Candidatus Dependentiae bacterium]